MEEKQKNSKFASFLSGIYILAALCLLLGVCSHCYPAFGQRLRQVIGGGENSPVRQAFGVLTEGFEAGKPIKETFAATIEVFTDGTD